MGLLLLQGASDLNPRELFANNEQGLWLDPSDFSTMWQDSGKTTPVTAAGDPVGYISDKSGRGNDAFQTTSASRPTLARIPSSGRRNLLTYSEDISNAVWGKTLTTITGTDTIVLSAGSASKFISYTITRTAPSTISFEAKAGTHRYIQVLSSSDSQHFVNIDLTDGVIGTAGTKAEGSVVQDLGDGWRRYRVTITTTGFSAIRFYAADSTSSVYGVSTNSTGSLQIRKIQLETGSTATNYQKVVATTDVTESGFGDLWHLVFDGSDDSLITNAVNFTATAQMTVIAGVRKLSDAAIGVVVELSANSGLSIGSFMLTASGQASPIAAYGSTLLGSAIIYSESPTSYAAPISNVVSLLSDTSQSTAANEQQMRIDGAQVALTTVGSDAGTSNFRNDILYIGRRNQATLPYNGHIYQLIIRGKTTPTGKLLEAEKFVSKKTGVNL